MCSFSGYAFQHGNNESFLAKDALKVWPGSRTGYIGESFLFVEWHVDVK